MTAQADSAVLDRLYAVIASRKGADPERSYTARLFGRGTGHIAKKTGEEAIETVIAALERSPEQVVTESADLLYHLLVLWADAGVEPAQVYAELVRREGTSGVDEKKARPRT
jgi:phosphoribosyl-ATP pyrophosphohydrolase